ncbi:15739_t:CDS:2 [Acaulospora morrowiae]|uniref:15739_t:CDS:1 n=1 Tax=Acaulospora morrowiae TaxID=94023 RepID=A0A9N9AP93_9GLOM|nr:15739_t:CDS:2 [Acaulospora morrowiae]
MERSTDLEGSPALASELDIAGNESENHKVLFHVNLPGYIAGVSESGGFRLKKRQGNYLHSIQTNWVSELISISVEERKKVTWES